jgi:hypothetical protein
MKHTERGDRWIGLAVAGSILVGVLLLCCGCLAHSDWYPPLGSTLTDCERVMGRPADEIDGHRARWFRFGGLEAYAEFDAPLGLRGVIVTEGGRVRQRHEFEIPKLIYFEWNGSVYRAMEPRASGGW